jgi:hypothetical protein
MSVWRFIVFFFIGLCVFAVPVRAQTMQANMPAQTVTAAGECEITQPPARYPLFTAADIFWNKSCGAYLAARNIDGQAIGGVATMGISLAPIHLKSSYASLATIGPAAAYTDVTGLQIVSYTIPKEYLTSAKLVVSWTMQVFNRSPTASEQVDDIQTRLCPGAPTSRTDPSLFPSQSYTQTYMLHRNFPGGFQVRTRLFVKPTFGTAGPKGGEFSVSMPATEPLTTTKVIRITGTKQPDPPPQSFRGNSCDPTVTGSVVLQPSDFGGRFPDMVTLTVQWLNDTPQTVFSPAKSRQMTVTIVPLNSEGY